MEPATKKVKNKSFSKEELLKISIVPGRRTLKYNNLRTIEWKTSNITFHHCNAWHKQKMPLINIRMQQMEDNVTDKILLINIHVQEKKDNATDLPTTKKHLIPS